MDETPGSGRLPSSIPVSFSCRLPGPGLGSLFGLGGIASSGLSARPLFREGVPCPQRTRTSHPSGLRQMERRPSLQPLAHWQPQKIFGTKPCPIEEGTEFWFPVWSTGQTLAGSWPGRIRSPTSDCTEREWDGTGANHIWWLLTNPNRWFPVPAILSDQSTAPPRKALGHALRSNTLAPTCGPPPSAPPRLTSWLACADRTGGSRDRGEWQNGPPR
jgi:hypothetical protein